VRDLSRRLGLQKATHQPGPSAAPAHELEVTRGSPAVEGDLPRVTPHGRATAVSEIVRSALCDGLADRRPAGLDRQNAFDQLRPRVGDAPADHAGLRMRQQD
jgi:hypothetical protein